jgi:hypothetical protein
MQTDIVTNHICAPIHSFSYTQFFAPFIDSLHFMTTTAQESDKSDTVSIRFILIVSLHVCLVLFSSLHMHFSSASVLHAPA